MSQTLHVQLEQFEGPLALLLYLIRKEEMDINDIQIHVITRQYLDYIQSMKKLDLEVASEFITMAATLIHIKSRILLPQYDELGEEVTEDPRRELVNRLVEYQRFQDGAKKLLQRPILSRDTWRKGFKEDIVLEENQEVEIDESGLFGLISMYRNLVKSAQKRIHRISQGGQSIASRILEIKDQLIPGHQKVLLTLIRPEEMTKNKLLVTFLSMLELAKIGFVRLFQSEPYSDIYIETLRPIENDVVSRVESYESQNAEAVAQNIISKGQQQLIANAALEQEKILTEQQAQAVIEEVSTQIGFQFEAHYKVEKSETPIEEIATDEEILMAEKELGIEAGNVPTEFNGDELDEAINPSLEPIEEIIIEQNVAFEIKRDDKKDFEPEI